MCSTKTKPSAEAIKKAKEAAVEKARLAREEQIQKDQAWLDDASIKMTEGERDELLRQASAKCKETAKDGDRIVVACPLPKKLQYCVDADPFTCPNGKAESAKGCKLSDDVSKSLKDETTCINGSFVSEAEGGSYMSPYVPWGPISGMNKKDGTPVLTAGNSSGVTIGTGVDLGAVKDSDAYLERLEKVGVSQETRDRLKPFLGKKKADACQALREAKKDGPLVLPSKDVELIDLDAMQSRVPQLKSQFKSAHDLRIKTLNKQIKAEKAKKAGSPDQGKIDEWQQQMDETNEFKDLTCAQQTVLFSTLYHQGGIGNSGIKPFVRAVLDSDDIAARAALVAKSKSADKLIASRGARELAFFDEGQ